MLSVHSASRLLPPTVRYNKSRPYSRGYFHPVGTVNFASNRPALTLGALRGSHYHCTDIGLDHQKLKASCPEEKRSAGLSRNGTSASFNLSSVSCSLFRTLPQPYQHCFCDKPDETDPVPRPFLPSDNYIRFSLQTGVLPSSWTSLLPKQEGPTGTLQEIGDIAPFALS